MIQERTMVLGRWQSWGRKELDFRDNQLTLGVNHDFTSVASLGINADAFFPGSGDNQYGLSVILQVTF